MHPKPLVPKRRDRATSVLLTAVERAVDLVGTVPSLPPRPRRIVVLRGCCLGDILLATPLLRALRRAYPAAHIVSAVGRWSRPALEHNPDLDGLLDLESVGAGRPRPEQYVRVLRRLRAGRFDVALVLDRTPLLTALPLLAGIPVRAGIDSAGRGFALNVRVPWTEVEHEARLFLRVGAALGIPTDGVGLRFVPSAADQDRAARLWRGAGLDGARVLALAPGGGRNPGMTFAAKQWPPERYAALADRLYDTHGLVALLTGDAHDRALTARIRGLTRSPAADLAGETSVGALGALYARSALFVGNDSGPTHLAAAMDIPVVAVFGPTDPSVYAPFNPRAIALRGPHGLSTSEVDVEQVVAASEQWLVGNG